MSVPVSPYLTVEQLLAIPPDGQRRELVYGELLVSPAPSMRHQALVFAIARRLAAYCERVGIGRVLLAPADITWGRDDALVQPDIFVADEGEARLGDWQALRRLLLAVEILSPATRQDDRYRKRLVYRDRGVPMYWIIDPDSGPAEIWTPDATFPGWADDHLTWHPQGAPFPFTASLRELRAG